MTKIRRMTIEDVDFGLKLSRQAGWNQIESDWLRLLKMEPDGCFAAEYAGRSVGTTTTCVFNGTAWIAMVLVEEGFRGKGIGTELLRYCLNYLDERNVKTVRLDATSRGRPLYEKLGFVPEYQLVRFEGASSCNRSNIVAKVNPAMLRDIVELDRRMSGTNRGKLFGRFLEEFPEDIYVVRRGDKIEGFIISRPGANAVQIGPCIANAEVGPVLLQDALARCKGKSVFVDVPVDNVGAVKIAESSGLKIQRYFMRMYRGQRIEDNVEAIWSSSGPEKG
ncbi:MAG: GNAT family N-acetyltransferase [Sedimentisphaerales bacterium]|nr:GNAT family N-acetyltransferase [Sedimentisphaerales bacterium]